MSAELKTECVEDLHGLIFDPNLDAGIELQKRISVLFKERDEAKERIEALEAALKLTLATFNVRGLSLPEEVGDALVAALTQNQKEEQR